MAQANYKVTVTDHDYHYTTYTAWVSASSKNQALVKAAALIGGEMTRREWLRMHREPVRQDLIEPDVRIEPVDLDEFWDNRDKVIVSDIRGEEQVPPGAVPRVPELATPSQPQRRRALGERSADATVRATNVNANIFP